MGQRAELLQANPHPNILDILKTYTIDRDLWRMISDGPEHLSIYEVAVAKAYRKIVGARGGVQR